MVSCFQRAQETIAIVYLTEAVDSSLKYLWEENGVAWARSAVLNLWVMTPLGVKRPLYRGHISGILHIRYLHYDK